MHAATCGVAACRTYTHAWRLNPPTIAPLGFAFDSIVMGRVWRWLTGAGDGCTGAAPGLQVAIRDPDLRRILLAANRHDGRTVALYLACANHRTRGQQTRGPHMELQLLMTPSSCKYEMFGRQNFAIDSLMIACLRVTLTPKPGLPKKTCHSTKGGDLSLPTCPQPRHHPHLHRHLRLPSQRQWQAHHRRP